MEEEKKEKTTKFDKDCARCALIFSCKGKPLDCKLCVKFTERGKNNG